MKIVMKEYNLDAFKEKDVYDWEEIIAVLEEQESKIKELEEELEDTKQNIKDNYIERPITDYVGNIDF